MKFRLFLPLVLSFTSLVAFAQEPIVIKFSHVVATDTPKGKGAEKFKELAELYTEGKVRVDVYPNSTLYKDKEEIENLQLGAVQMLAPSLAKFGPLGVRAFEAFDLPFIFDNYEDLHKVTMGSVGQKILDMLEPKGIKGLTYWDNGFKSFSANTPISKPTDLRSKKMRIQSSKVLEEQMKALKALPQVMAFSDVYQGLQTGVVDGTENPISNLYTQKMHEVQKHLALTNHGYLGYAVITNKKFWEGLPNDIREQLTKALNEATVYANSIAKEENDLALEAVRKAGKTEIRELSKEERLAFKKVLVPVHEKMAKRIGADLIKEMQQATDFNPNIIK